MKNVGARIKQILKANKQTQKELSQATGIPESTLSDILREKKEPGVDKMRLIAEFLKVDLHWLVEGKSFRETDYGEGKIAEIAAASEYGARSPIAALPAAEAGEPRLNYLGEIIAILKTLDEEERRLILDMAERLQQKKQ